MLYIYVYIKKNSKIGRDASENIEFHSNKMLEIAKKYYIGHLKGYEEPKTCIIL